MSWQTLSGSRAMGTNSIILEAGTENRRSRILTIKRGGSSHPVHLIKSQVALIGRVSRPPPPAAVPPTPAHPSLASDAIAVRRQRSTFSCGTGSAIAVRLATGIGSLITFVDGEAEGPQRQPDIQVAIVQ